MNLVVLAATIIAISRIHGIWASPATSVSALQFNLVSSLGKSLATLGVNATGIPSLTFYDANGKPLTQVGEGGQGKSAGLYAFDGDTLLAGTGMMRASLGVSAAGAGEEEFDGTGTQRVGTGIAADSSSDGVTLYDAKKILRASIAETRDSF